MAIEELRQRLDEIATYLSEGEAWHRRTANELRKLPNRRGFARWHEAESECDQHFHLKLDKLIRDNLKYSPAVDMSYVSRAETYSVGGAQGFKDHFAAWIARENVFLAAINSAITYAGQQDMELYQCLCALAKEVKNEALRAEWALLGLEDTQWSPHDVRVVSKWLHDYFECNYQGGTIDFNIG